jgi:hypothetical protein
MSDSIEKIRMIGTVASAKSRKGLASETATDLEKARSMAQGLPGDGEAGSSGSYVGCVPANRPTPRDAALQEVASAQAGLGQFQAARNSLSAIQDPEVREDVLVTLSGAAAQQRDFNPALAVAGEVSRPECRSEALSWIALFQYRAGDAAAAFHTVAGIPSVRERVNALLNISSRQMRKEPEVVPATLVLASEVALQIPDPAERLDALLQVARRQVSSGFLRQARATLLSAKIAVNDQPANEAADGAGSQAVQGRSRLPRNWNSVLVSLSDLLAETGDLAAAADIARRVHGLPFPAVTIARAAVRGGHLDAARPWVDSLPSVSDRSLALAGLALGILDRAQIGRTPNASIW